MIQDKVTVITVCYNCVDDIDATLSSVTNQSYPNIEYIVIDGGSNDGTLEVIKKYSSKIDILISESDQGVYDAMNKGIRIASGDWINFMNAGDSFASTTAIEDVFRVADTSSPNDIIYGDVILRYPFGNYYNICDHGNWCHQSLFSRASVLKNLEFDLSFKIMADENFVHQAEKRGSKLEYVPICVAIYENYSGLSNTSDEKMFREKSRIHNVPHTLLWHLRAYYYRYASLLRSMIPAKKRIESEIKRLKKSGLKRV